MRHAKLFAFLAVLFSVAIAPAVALAGGPLFVFDPATGVPYKYKAPVKVYTDLGTLGPLSNEAADAKVAASWKQWTDVPTSSFEAHVEGDFASLGIGDVTAANAGQIFGTYNNGGIHVVYDTDGSILRDYFGVGGTVLGVASPEFMFEGTNEIAESWVILNGRGISSTDTAGNGYAGVMTHEFGHSINLAHSQTNGAIVFYGDAKGPTGCTTLPYAGAPVIDDLETMYPFINPTQTGAAQFSVDHADDIASISNIYPEAGWESNHGTIAGTITGPDGQTQATGVNVIARNIANPWRDAVSAMSGDHTQGAIGADGRYTFHGLTPNAQYVVYIDGIVAGGFSTPSAANMPGPEEFYSGASESGNAETDLACSVETITAGAGVTYTADISFNATPGAPGLEILANDVSPTDISADGSTIVGMFGGFEAPAFKWTREGGIEVIGGIGPYVSMSSDGSKITSSFRGENGLQTPGVWQGGTTWSPIALPATSVVGVGNKLGSAFGISDNGDVVGLFYDGTPNRVRTFRFDAATNTAVKLDAPAWSTQSRGNGITADGTTSYGMYRASWGFFLGAVWRDGVMTPIGTNEVPVGEVWGSSGDGSVFVGSNVALQGSQAYRWTFEGGLEPIGTIPFAGFGYASAYATNHDGSVIVGFAGNGPNRRGWIWTRQLGMMNVDEFLAAQGTFLQPGWTLNSPLAVSADGRKITGWGLTTTNVVGWLVDIQKVKVCHAPPGNPSNKHAIEVSFPEGIEDHLAHGDTLGPCECEDEGNGNGNGGH
jgi:hypothetical protein